VETSERKTRWRSQIISLETCVKCSLSGTPGAVGMLVGIEPAEKADGKALVGATLAPAMMEERGTAVGFCDANVKVGSEEVERFALELRLEPEERGLEPAAGVLLPDEDEDEGAEEGAATA
jgi:hypothetical protein